MAGADMRALAARSAWLAEIPSLSEQTLRWLDDVPSLRRAAEARGGRLARPRLSRTSVTSTSRTAGRVAGVVVAGVRDRGRAAVSRAGRRRAAPPTATALRTARRAERLVRAGGPAYVKFGQFVASAKGMVSDELVDALAWCCDEVPPLEPGVAQATIERALGRPVRDLFATFEDEPFAAASIAQVHAATLADGTEVVVKVRRPGLTGRFAADISAMALGAWAGTKATARARMANLPAVIDLFARLCMQELDLRIEALNMVRSAWPSRTPARRPCGCRGRCRPWSPRRCS